MDVVVQPGWKGLSETIEHVSLLKAQATPVVESCRAVLAAGSEQLQLAIQLLQVLGMRGVMTLLGCRQTAGSLNCRTAHPLDIGLSDTDHCFSTSTGLPLTGKAMQALYVAGIRRVRSC